MKATTKSLALAATLLNTACASNPDNMSASDTSPLKYQKYDCEQVELEADRINKKLTHLHSSLKKKADNDAMQMGVGLVLFWPTLFFLEGGDGAEAVEYRQLKGDYEALRQASIKKKCAVEFRKVQKKKK